jgi:hypothetical protein
VEAPASLWCASGTGVKCTVTVIQGKQYRDIIQKESLGVQRALGLSYLRDLGVTK